MKDYEQAFGPAHSRQKSLQLVTLSGVGLALRGLAATNNLEDPAERIFIMGAGPSGLVRGYELRRAGHHVANIRKQ